METWPESPVGLFNLHASDWWRCPFSSDSVPLAFLNIGPVNLYNQMGQFFKTSHLENKCICAHVSHLLYLSSSPSKLQAILYILYIKSLSDKHFYTFQLYLFSRFLMHYTNHKVNYDTDLICKYSRLDSGYSSSLVPTYPT